MLNDGDQRYLAERWPEHEVQQDGTTVNVIIPGFALPAGYAPSEVTLLLRLPFGFPEAQPDMFWADPVVTLNGVPPAATDQRETYCERTWQRFSRHLQPGQWRPGRDDLRSWIATITTILAREAGPEASAA